MSKNDRALMEASAGERLQLIKQSFERLSGTPLFPFTSDIWNAPRAIVAHGTQEVPEFFYGNAMALSLFKMSAQDFIGLPSHKSAQVQHRKERAQMLDQLNAANIVRNYEGIRIASDGARFLIKDAYIWNVIDEKGLHHGQAACFDQWEILSR